MLEFFRKYQRYFFLFITTIIVISFSFFGTYNSLPGVDLREQPAFKAVDGTIVSQNDLDEMVRFISTDTDDKVAFGGMWGPNFLNDGVIRKDILQNGTAEILAAQYATAIAPDFENRQMFEKNYALYTHPEVSFISSQSAWNYFAPNMLPNYEKMTGAQNPLDSASFQARVRLYLGEKNFSPQMLKQVLRYQEKQFSWVKPDDSLDRMDLSLFGYHTLNDWFGPRFMQIAAEYIINSAKIAEQRGYSVSKQEALADLTRNAELSYQQNLRSPHLSVATSQQYLNEQLRQMNMDQNRAVKLWQTVLLARRLFQDAGSVVLVSPVMFENITDYAKESVQGDLYQLPKELKLSDYAALQNFQVYLEAVAAQNKEENSLLLPQGYRSVSEIKKTTPELLQKRYLLNVAVLDKNSLLPKISIKDTWKWEADPANWNQLKKQFPELALKEASSTNDTFKALESLNDSLRQKIDAYAREQILSTRPELITKALADEPVKEISIGLPLKGQPGEPFTGIKDTSSLISLLDQASLGGKEKTPTDQKLDLFTTDNRHFYKIQVIERFPNEEILTFAEANKKGILDGLTNKKLQAHYLKIRETNPQNFQKADKSWKDLKDVKDLVADSYFKPILQAIQAQNPNEEKLTGNLAARKRLLAYVESIKQKLQTNPEKASEYIRESQLNQTSIALQDQWKLEKKPLNIDRSMQNEPVNTVDAFAMPAKDWSNVLQGSNGAISFYQKQGTQKGNNGELLLQKVNSTRNILSTEVQRLLVLQLLKEMKAKNAISIDYLETGSQLSAN